MSGIINKISDALHVGGHKEEDKHKSDASHVHKPDKHHGEHKPDEHHGEHKPEHHAEGAEHKEGLIDKIKDKIHGDDSKEGEKKKKKEKKKKDGHDKDDGSSSSSDSD